MERDYFKGFCSFLAFTDIILIIFCITALLKLKFSFLKLMMILHEKFNRLSVKQARVISILIMGSLIFIPISFLLYEALFDSLYYTHDKELRNFAISSINKICLFFIALFISYYYSSNYSSLVAKIMAIVFLIIQWSFQVMSIEIFTNYKFYNWILFLNYFGIFSRSAIHFIDIFRNRILISKIYKKLVTELLERYFKNKLNYIEHESDNEEEKENDENPNENKNISIKNESNENPGDFYSRLEKMNIKRDIPLESGERQHDYQEQPVFKNFPSIASSSNESVEEVLNTPDNEGKDIMEIIIKETKDDKQKFLRKHKIFCGALVAFLFIIMFLVHSYFN